MGRMFFTTQNCSRKSLPSFFLGVSYVRVLEGVALFFVEGWRGGEERAREGEG